MTDVLGTFRTFSFWLLVVAAVPAGAQPVAGYVRVGTLTPPGIVSPEEGLREGLNGLGYMEGKNLTIERRRGDSAETMRVGALALVQLKVHVIVAFGTSAARAAMAATSTVPVVFISGDPVATGLVSSLARPGANATGVSTVNTELIPKRFELLQEVVPTARRMMLLANPDSPLYPQELRNAQSGASALQMQLILLTARNVGELAVTLGKIQRGQADGFTTSSDVLFLSMKSKIAEAVVRAKLPAVFPWPNDHDAGVLMAYGASTRDMGLRAASYIDRILRGARPAELPIEQISKYELLVDLRAARSLGIKVPQELIVRADEVIR